MSAIAAPTGDSVARMPDLEAPPLSLSQQRLWFLQQLDPHSSEYTICVGYLLRGELDRQALDAAVQRVWERHSALRTRFPTQSGTPAPDLDDAAQRLEVTEVDLRDEEPSTVRNEEADIAWARARAFAGRQADRAFDLGDDTLVRVHLLRLADRCHVLLLTAHHIVVDAWSMQILVDELGEGYRAAVASDRAESDPPGDYADFARWQRNWLASPEAERQLGYWRRRMQGVPAALDLPLDRPRPQAPSPDGREHRFKLRPELVARLRALAGSERASLFMAALTAFAMLVGRYAHTSDIPIAVPVAGRPAPQFERIVGFFVNTLPIRAQLDEAGSFRDALATVRRELLDGVMHGDVPFDRIVDSLELPRDLSVNPLAQVSFQLLHIPQRGDTVAWGPLEVSEWDEIEERTTRFDLEFHLVESGAEAVDGLVCYRAELFDPETIQSLTNDYLALIEQIVDTPDAARESLPPSPPRPPAASAPHPPSANSASPPRPPAVFVVQEM